MKEVTVRHLSCHRDTSIWPKFGKTTKEEFFFFNRKENQKEAIS
jgi:hypothetical protein